MPNRRAWASAGIVFALFVLVCTVTDADEWLSAHFYDPQRGWYLQYSAPWWWLYEYGEYPALVCVTVACLGFLGGLRKASWAQYRHGCVVVVLAVALGPGLLVNGVLKPFWGRPRPRQIAQFGGTQAFRMWWQPGGAGAGTSFPSGHAAMGFVLVAATTLISPARCCVRRWVWGAALLYGMLMGGGRIVQGGHFLSDVVWAGGVSCGITILLQMILPHGRSVLPQPTA